MKLFDCYLGKNQNFIIQEIEKSNYYDSTRRLSILLAYNKKIVYIKKFV